MKNDTKRMKRMSNRKMTELWHDNKFDNTEKSILWFLFHRDNYARQIDDIDILVEESKMEKPHVILIVAKLMNEGYVSRVIDANGYNKYVLSLEGFEYMSHQTFNA